MEQSLIIIRNIWKITLGIEKLGDDDHFFILGGDSLLASIMVLSTTEAIGSEVSLLDLYENPTLKEFADLVHQRRILSIPMN